MAGICISIVVVIERKGLRFDSSLAGLNEPWFVAAPIALAAVLQVPCVAQAGTMVLLQNFGSYRVWCPDLTERMLNHCASSISKGLGISFPGLTERRGSQEARSCSAKDKISRLTLLAVGGCTVQGRRVAWSDDLWY